MHTINTGNHTFYASNTSGLSEHSTVLYGDQSIPSAIKVTTHFRYLIYVPLINDKSSLEICEIGIVGESFYHIENKHLRNSYISRE